MTFSKEIPCAKLTANGHKEYLATCDLCSRVVVTYFDPEPVNLESPNFTPEVLENFRKRGWKRENRWTD